MGHCFTTYWMSVYKLIQYTDYLMWRHVSSMPMSLLCSCSRICYCEKEGKIMHLPSSAMPSIIMSSCLISQYFSTPSSTAPWHVAILQLYTLSICSSTSSSVTTFISSISKHIWISTVVFMACILMFMPDIS